MQRNDGLGYRPKCARRSGRKSRKRTQPLELATTRCENQTLHDPPPKRVSADTSHMLHQPQRATSTGLVMKLPWRKTRTRRYETWPTALSFDSHKRPVSTTKTGLSARFPPSQLTALQKWRPAGTRPATVGVRLPRPVGRLVSWGWTRDGRVPCAKRAAAAAGASPILSGRTTVTTFIDSLVSEPVFFPRLPGTGGMSRGARS